MITGDLKIQQRQLLIQQAKTHLTGADNRDQLFELGHQYLPFFRSGDKGSKKCQVSSFLPVSDAGFHFQIGYHTGNGYQD